MIDHKNFNELFLILKSMGGIGLRVEDVVYFQENITAESETFIEIGASQGFVASHQFFFGNISIFSIFAGVPTGGYRNVVETALWTQLFQRPSMKMLTFYLGVNCGTSLLGDGNYAGYKRLYGIGCNEIHIAPIGIAGMTWDYEAVFNGYMFTMI